MRAVPLRLEYPELTQASSAGVKDSPLTVHGSLQADRLAKHLAGSGFPFAHVFSSDLQRAFRTATAICKAADTTDPESTLQVTALSTLREQDFGFYEGKPFYARPQDSGKSGKDDHRSQHQDDPDFKDVESKESMALRMNDFLEHHLLPIIHTKSGIKTRNIAVVSHGIILSQLWRCFLKLLPKNSVSLSPGLFIGDGGVEHLGGWSNTGYLELDVLKDGSTTEAGPPVSTEFEVSSQLALNGYKVIIRVVNGKEHLTGLKRTRGGVGSSTFDEGQKSIESFFKKRKL